MDGGEVSNVKIENEGIPEILLLNLHPNPNNEVHYYFCVTLWWTNFVHKTHVDFFKKKPDVFELAMGRVQIHLYITYYKQLIMLYI